MEISISDKGYKGRCSSHYFTKNGTYYMEVEVNFGNDVKPLFPQMSISCMHLQDGKRFSVVLYKAAAATRKVGGYIPNADPGTYTIMATLKISGEKS